MWTALREMLAYCGLCKPGEDRLLVRGSILPPVKEGGSCTMSLSIGDRPATLSAVSPDGQFNLRLPVDQVVRLVIARTGHLPRVLEIQPMRTSFRFARAPLRVRCSVELVLTPRSAPGVRPLLERIIMSKDRRPLMVEWDHTLHADRSDEFVPLFSRTG